LGGFAATDPPFFRTAAAYAPALFLQIADALDDVCICGGGGEGSSRAISDEDQERMSRAVLKQLSRRSKNILISEKDKRLLGCRDKPHPPPWLRAHVSTLRTDELYRSRGAGHRLEVQYGRELILKTRALIERAGPEIMRLIQGEASGNRPACSR
jgi:hypothetical protein